MLWFTDKVYAYMIFSRLFNQQTQNIQTSCLGWTVLFGKNGLLSMQLVQSVINISINQLNISIYN